MKIQDAKKLKAGDIVLWKREGFQPVTICIQRIRQEPHSKGSIYFIKGTNGVLQKVAAANMELILDTADELDAVLPKKVKVPGGLTAIKLDTSHPWFNNEIQFARLLCELVANMDDDTQTKRVIKAVAESMDLTADQVNSLFDRADEVWEKAKSANLRHPSKQGVV